MFWDISACVLQRTTPQMHHIESPFVILTNYLSLTYTTSQTATALLPPIRHINSLMMWPTIHWGQEKMLLSTSAVLVGIVQRHSSPIKINSALAVRKNLKQTFGPHLSMGSNAGNSALEFKGLDHVRKKHTWFQDFFFTGKIHELFVENQGKGCSLNHFHIDILGRMSNMWARCIN